MTVRNRVWAIIAIASGNDKIGSPNFCRVRQNAVVVSSANLPHCAVTRANEPRCRIDDTRLRVIVFVRSAPRPTPAFQSYRPVVIRPGSSRANAFSFRALSPRAIFARSHYHSYAGALFRKFLSANSRTADRFPSVCVCVFFPPHYIAAVQSE